MNNLAKYIGERNMWSKFVGRPQIDVNNMTQANVNDIALSLDCDMSPENLHCDGEISAVQARRKAKLFTAAFKELSLLATTKGFTLPETYELY